MIDVVLCSDENYAPYSAVVMISALTNTKYKEGFHFHLLTTGLKEETEAKLKSTILEYGAKIDITTVNASITRERKIELGRFGIAALFRLYMHRYLDKSIKRVIYLDCDLVILGDLKQLWEQDLADKTVGAVTDLCSPSSYSKRVTDYFNSGVLLINLEKWRNKNIGENALENLITTPYKYQYLDQDVLNDMLKKDWLSLDLSWNVQPTSYNAYKKNYEYLLARNDELYNSIKCPNIVHFIGPIKPWHATSTHPFQDAFIQFSEKTPWPIKLKERQKELTLLKRFTIWNKKKVKSKIAQRKSK